MQGTVGSDEDPIIYYELKKITGFDLQLFIRMLGIKELIMLMWIMVLFSYSSNNNVRISRMYLRLRVFFVFVLKLYHVLELVLGLVLCSVGLYLYIYNWGYFVCSFVFVLIPCGTLDLVLRVVSLQEFWSFATNILATTKKLSLLGIH